MAKVRCRAQPPIEPLCFDNPPIVHAAKIVTGSYHGMLRIYFPHQREYKIEDLMLEQDLGHPILQIECGKFLPYVENRLMCLAACVVLCVGLADTCR